LNLFRDAAKIPQSPIAVRLSSMHACPACAHGYPEGSRFCPHCSKALDATSAATEVMGASISITSTSTVDEGRFLPGTVVGGRYRIAGLLGRGGMGEVYRATDLTLGQAVALKFLPEATSNDERALVRFYNEVRVARQVTHPNVCRVYDVGQVQNLHYISMEYVDGEDLGVLLRRIGRLPADKGVETARKICAGLAAAHEKGVLHRDLKPANVMIDGRGQVIIMDFGLAGLAGQLQGDVRSGTPAYMSPEQLAGTEVTTKSDIYALGLVLYEIFTGKQAFQASSLIELMQMQEHAAPASITTVAKELDPAVERVIMRCLSPDPRQRPASALAVSAALPGGDPLAAALAAGETPSPELVAAAGETEGLAPRTAVAWLAAAVAGLALSIYFGPRESVVSRLNLEASPEALTRDARALIKSFGYTAKPADAAWGLAYDDDYRRYADTHQSESAARWKNAAVGQPPIVHFWYRESPQPIVPSYQMNVIVGWNNPPLEMSGMVRLQTDPDGKLTKFEAVPPQVEAPAPPSPPFDWNRLFQAAGLNLSAYQPVEPTWTPLSNWDTRAAWTGSDAATGTKVRIEAAAWRGRPVSFRIVGPWTTPSRMNPAGNSSQIPALVIIYSALIAACVIAWFNFRAGRMDSRGALRLLLIYFIAQSANLLIAIHHSATVDEISVFWLAISGALLNALLCWVFYVALEPWARRKWPQTLISWSRYVSKGLRDPVVGRDLLFGTVLGLALNFTDFLGPALHGNSGQLNHTALNAMLGVRQQASAIIATIPNGVINTLLFFFILFLIRLLVRKEWIAALVFIVLLGVVFNLNTTTPAVDLPIACLAFAIVAVTVLRFGLLAYIVTSAISSIASQGALLDFSAWYAGMAAIPFVIITLVAVYGFKTALGGRRLFKFEA
jgi:serine/threonine-protein kinase